MGRKRISNEKTTISIDWEVKEELLAHVIGRETDNDVLKRILKMVKKRNKEIIRSPEYREYEEKLNRPKRSRKR